MDTQQLQDQLNEWSRHYDALLWNVTTIFAAAIGGLLAYSYSNFDLVFSLAGLLLTIVPVYFAASFREVRRLVDLQIDKKIRDAMYPKRRLHQWSLYVALFMLLELLWVRVLIMNYPCGCIWFLVGACAWGVTIWCARLGRASWGGEQDGSGADTMNERQHPI